MTAHAMAGDEQKSHEAGMDDHVTEPIDPDKLFATLQKWIRPPAERADSRKPQPLDATPEPDQAEAVEDNLPGSLAGFDLSAGLSPLMGNKVLYRKLCLILGQTMVESQTKSMRRWHPGILSRPTVWSIT